MEMINWEKGLRNETKLISIDSGQMCKNIDRLSYRVI